MLISFYIEINKTINLRNKTETKQTNKQTYKQTSNNKKNRNLYIYIFVCDEKNFSPFFFFPY